MRIILASQSPARRELMKKLAKKMGFRVEFQTSDYPEDMRAYKQAWRLAEHLALGKARHVATQRTKKFPNAIIVGADTFITCGHDQHGQKKIGKPTSITDAKRIIRSMSGKIIGVYSGLAVVSTDARGDIIQEEVTYALTRLWVKRMSPEEVDRLAHQKNALQISGAFSIEGEGGKMITRIDGDYDNVIGLPIFILEAILTRYGTRSA